MYRLKASFLLFCKRTLGGHCQYRYGEHLFALTAHLADPIKTFGSKMNDFVLRMQKDEQIKDDPKDGAGKKPA